MKFIILLLLFEYNAIINAQSFDDSLYLHLYNYEVIKGELKPNEIELNNLKNSFYIKGLDENVYADTFKIFRFYNLMYSEAISSFLIIEGSNIEIYDLQSINYLICKILNIDNICPERRIAWVKEILRIFIVYDVNNVENTVLKKKYGRYKYYILSKNLKYDNGILK